MKNVREDLYVVLNSILLEISSIFKRESYRDHLIPKESLIFDKLFNQTRGEVHSAREIVIRHIEENV